MERYIPVPQTRPKPPRAWLLFLQAGYKRAVLGTTILSNGKDHFGPTDRNDQTGQRGPPSKLVPNIPVGPNRNGPFHLMYQPKLPEFWVEWKAPWVVPKSYRPKGQPRSTRNEFPIRADFGNSRKHPIWRLKRGEN